MDDRILIAYPHWGGGSSAPDRWPAFETFHDRLMAFLPVDTFQWPFEEAREVDDHGAAVIEAFASAARAQHHIVSIGGSAGEALLLGLTRAATVPRSITFIGFFPAPLTLRAAGLPADSAASAEVVYQATTKPHQLVQMVMAGASEEAKAEMARDLDQSVDYKALEAYFQSEAQAQFGEIRPIRCPALYLRLPLAVPGLEPAEEILRGYLPDLRVDQLDIQGLQLQSSAQGNEAPDKVIPFIQEVIAGRQR